jgi:HrpA-like RNA helicase
MEKLLKLHSDEAMSQGRPHYWKVLPLHSSVTVEQQYAVFQRVKPIERKVIISTNIAESSITVEDIDFVIDFCLAKNLVVDVDTHFPTLQLEWAAKSNCDQRAGRTGRCSVGRVYRLVDQAFYNQFQTYQPPEMERSPLELSVLRVKKLAIYGPPKELLGLTLDPPNLSDIHQAVLHLKQVGALTVRMPLSEQDKLDLEDDDESIKGHGTAGSYKSRSQSKGARNVDYNPDDYYYDHENGDLTCIGKCQILIIIFL